MKIRFTLNNQAIEMESPPDCRVVDLLREQLALTGTKEACGSGECGACTIHVDGVSKLSCLMLAAQLEGREIKKPLCSDSGIYPRALTDCAS